MLKPLLAAFAFLTCIPVFSAGEFGAAEVARAMPWFPLVGCFLGAISASLLLLLRPWLPSSVIAVSILIAETALTGALHVDALADMADGFGGGRTSEDVLRIMRDHAIGSYGGAAIVLLMLFKAACITALITQPRALSYLVLIPSLGRWSTVLLSRMLPYARLPEKASTAASSSVSSIVSRRDLAMATLVCGVIALCCAQWRGLVCWVLVILLTVFTASICRRRIGGITGDTLGANLEVAETAQLMLALILQ